MGVPNLLRTYVRRETTENLQIALHVLKRHERGQTQMEGLIGSFSLRDREWERKRLEKDERQRKRRGDVLEELQCIATAGYCR